VARASFAAEKAQLDEACELLRSFTLGLKGSTPRDGIHAIERVNACCERLKKLFSTGTNAKQMATIVSSARARIAAAEARLALLNKKNEQRTARHG
jgi:hypothetical protein